MSQLPPKIPPQNWASALKTPPLSPSPQKQPPQLPPATSPSSWADEFLDFTSSRRGNHRRSMSDSITFLEVGNCGNVGGFDRLDDAQLMSMFSDDVSAAVSSPSDQTSNNDDRIPTNNNGFGYGYGIPNQDWVPKTEPAEIESVCKNTDNLMSAGLVDNSALENNNSDNADPFSTDPKRIKRVLANRQSAQRSRVRKLQYISELERSVTSLQTEVSVLSPRVAYLDHQRLILSVDNSAIKQRIAALAQDKIFKDAHQEALKVELERLRQVYHHQQQQQNMTKLGSVVNCSSNAVTTAIVQPQSSDHSMNCSEKEQIMI